MNYSIAFFLPNDTTYETVKRTLYKLNYHCPVYAKSTYDAVSTARELLPKGLRLVISHGLTLQYLNQELSIPSMALPFSGLDTLQVVRSALKYTGKRIVHIGTRDLYHYVQRSLEILGADPHQIAFCELSLQKPQEQSVQELIDEGYDIFIGGFTTVNYAVQQGKIGFQFDVDELNVKETLLNAQRFLRSILELEERNELDRAILQSTPDGIVVIDSACQIKQVNSTALDIIQAVQTDLLGVPINDALAKHNIINVEQENAENKPGATQVLIRELPVLVRGQQVGTVLSMNRVSDIQDLGYRIRADLLQSGLVAKYTFDDILGKNPAILEAKSLAYTYAKYDSPIFLYGETGKGKELFAQSIHNSSKRRNQPFVAINCASLSESLIESELFGYVHGAFTGAKRSGKPGLFELAHKGTIFLDEISEIPMTIQSKLLRAIQEGEIMRVGDDKMIHVDVRVICSSNKDLLQLILENRFKEDLYYRLNVLEVIIPPLRERASDIELLAYSFMRKYVRKYGKMIDSISPDVLSALSHMHLRGNIRELRNIIERMVILAPGHTLDIATLEKCQFHFLEYSQPSDSKSSLTFKEAQKEMIIDAIEKCGGNKIAAAKQLGIDVSTLYRKLKAYQC